MHVLVVDDEKTALGALIEELKLVFLDTDIYGTQSPKAAIKWAETLAVQKAESAYAFLDICMDEMSGLELAKRLKMIFPKLVLIFCTESTEYAYQAFELHAKGYLLKPATAKAIEEVLDEMVTDWRDTYVIKKARISIHTFGHFEVYVDGKLLNFRREKAKELFAFLVDRHGAAVTTEQIAVTLWENRTYDREMKNIVTSITSSLRATLKDAGVEDVLIKTWNHLAIDVRKVMCDAYEFERRNPKAIPFFHGEYMSNYSWAEFSTGKYIL